MPRLLLLLPTTTYRTAVFLGAARRLGAEVVVASERAGVFQKAQPGRLLALASAISMRPRSRSSSLPRRAPSTPSWGLMMRLWFSQPPCGRRSRYRPTRWRQSLPGRRREMLRR